MTTVLDLFSRKNTDSSISEDLSTGYQFSNLTQIYRLKKAAGINPLLKVFLSSENGAYSSV